MSIKNVLLEMLRHDIRLTTLTSLYPLGIPKNNRFCKMKFILISSEKTFFRKYKLKTSGNGLLSVLNNDLYLGADGDGFTNWRDEYGGMGDQLIASDIADGVIPLMFPSQRGKAIYDFISTFKRMPDRERLTNIKEFMQTYGALK